MPLEQLRLADDARLVALVKPTFELGSASLVVDGVRVRAAIAAAVASVERAGWRCPAITLPGAR